MLLGHLRSPSGPHRARWSLVAKFRQGFGSVQDQVDSWTREQGRRCVWTPSRCESNLLGKLKSADDSKRIRVKFGSAFKAGADPLPPGLSDLSIRIHYTHASRVCLAIMQVLAANYKASNPGAKTQVINYEPRLLMRFTPAPGSSDPRVLKFNIIEAVTKLPLKFTRKDLARIMQVVSGKFKGQLRSLFVAISDDDRVTASRSRHRDSETSSSGLNSGSGSGSEAEDDYAPDPSAQRTHHSTSSRNASEIGATAFSSSARKEAPPSTSRGHKSGLPPPKGGKSKSHRR